MSAFILYATLALQILPLLPAAVRAAEDLFGAGNGAQKAAFVIAALTNSLDLARITGAKAAEVIQLATRLISSTVAMMNATGLLPKAKPALIEEPTPAG